MPVKAKEVIDQLQSIDSVEVQTLLLRYLSQFIKARNMGKKFVNMEIQHSFLSSLLEQKCEDIELFGKQVDVLKEEDLANIENMLEAEKVAVPNNSQLSLFHLPHNSAGTSYLQGSTTTDSIKSQKLTCGLTHFNELAEHYIQTRIPSCFGTTSSNGLENWGTSLSELTEYSEFRKLKTIKYKSLVPSIDFDYNQLFFAAAEMNEIKIHDFRSVMQSSNSVHYPVQDVKCNTNISFLSYNNFLQNQLAFCCYDGSVAVTDVHTGAITRSWKEHSSRCHSIHCNHADPKITASASADFTIKGWSIDVPHSVAVVHTGALAFTDRFHPASRNYLACGGAGQKVYYHDLRNPHVPLHIMEGHKKPVSYCCFLNDQELISLSMDNDLKLWNINTGECLKTYTGRKNKKTFLGLSVNSNLMIFGSEDNRVYAYCKHVSKHVTLHYTTTEEPTDPICFLCVLEAELLHNFGCK